MDSNLRTAGNLLYNHGLSKEGCKTIASTVDRKVEIIFEDESVVKKRMNIMLAACGELQLSDIKQIMNLLKNDKLKVIPRPKLGHGERIAVQMLEVVRNLEK